MPPDWAILHDACEDWRGLAAYNHRRRAAPKASETEVHALGLWGALHRLPSFPPDPLDLARRRLHVDTLTPEHVAFVVLDILIGAPPPDRDVKALVTDALAPYPDAAPWDLGVAHSLGWRNAPPPLPPLIARSYFGLLVYDQLHDAFMTMSAHKVPSGMKIVSPDQPRLAERLAAKLIASDCVCHHHTGTPTRRCRETAARRGKRCGVECCLHRLCEWRPDEMERLEGFVFKALLGKLGTLAQAELAKGLVVRTLVAMDLSDPYYPHFRIERELPGRPPIAYLVRIRIGTVAFWECRGTCYESYPPTARCPRDWSHEDREPDGPVLRCTAPCGRTYKGKQKQCHWGHPRRVGGPHDGAARCSDPCRACVHDELHCPRRHPHVATNLPIDDGAWRCLAACLRLYERGIGCGMHEPSGNDPAQLRDTWVFVEKLDGHFAYAAFHDPGTDAWKGHPVEVVGDDQLCATCARAVDPGFVITRGNQLFHDLRRDGWQSHPVEEVDTAFRCQACRVALDEDALVWVRGGAYEGELFERDTPVTDGAPGAADDEVDADLPTTLMEIRELLEQVPDEQQRAEFMARLIFIVTTHVGDVRRKALAELPQEIERHLGGMSDG